MSVPHDEHPRCAYPDFFPEGRCGRVGRVLRRHIAETAVYWLFSCITHKDVWREKVEKEK